MPYFHGIQVIQTIAVEVPKELVGPHAYLINNFGYRITIGGVPLVIPL